MTTLQIVQIVGLILTAFALFRNSWVFRYRNWVLENPDHDVHRQVDNIRRLPDYSTMFLQFWKWNYSEFLLPETDGNEQHSR